METAVNPPAELATGAGAPAPGIEHGRRIERGPGISIIVPCWRNDGVAEAVAMRWLRNEAVREVLVALAGGTACAAAAAPAVRLVPCTRAGRGTQMNEAARLAGGEILLFHHADTELTDEHLRSLSAAMLDPALAGGAFRRRFDERHPHLRWLEPFEALRCRCFGPVFGDQSIFVRRTVFEAMGGFADVALMEDVEFSCRLRRRGRLAVLTPAIGSSARKHLEQGRWRRTLANAWLLFLYVVGVAPQRLHAWYYRRSRS
jgi:rSAM/selenodomain-associated transferase 2